MRDVEPRKRALTLEYWRDLLLVLTLLITGLVYGAGFLIPLSFALLVFVLLTAVIDRVAALEIGGRQVPRLVAHLAGIALILLGFVMVWTVNHRWGRS